MTIPGYGALRAKPCGKPRASEDAPAWTDTRSCWQQSRQSSVGHHRRQCGVCAACMLRRMSMFTAGIEEPAETYVWERLSAARFERAQQRISSTSPLLCANMPSPASCTWTTWGSGRFAHTRTRASSCGAGHRGGFGRSPRRRRTAVALHAGTSCCGMAGLPPGARAGIVRCQARQRQAMSDELTTAEIGERLRMAREAAKATQAAAAEALQVARTTVVAIEQGQRRPRLGELQQFASLYGVSVNGLLRREACTDRSKAALPPRRRSRLRRGSRRRVADHACPGRVGAGGSSGCPACPQRSPERPLLPGNVAGQAEQDAAELRQWLGIGVARYTT